MKQRIKFFDDARGSATECAACLDILVAKKTLGIQEIVVGQKNLISIVSLLSKVIQYFEEKFAVGKDAGKHGGQTTNKEIEEEDE